MARQSRQYVRDCCGLFPRPRWWVSGDQHARTLGDRLRHSDEHAEALRPISLRTCAPETTVAGQVDWRLFLLARAETFVYGGGQK